MGMSGSELVAESILRQGARDFFFIMGAPMLSVESAALKRGIRGIDVRHEQAAAMAAHAYSRLLRVPSFCMAASGPGTTNLITGVAHAFADGSPVVALGGSSPVSESGRGVFQEIDQLSLFKPCTKWCERVHHAHRIPEMIDRAIRIAMSGRPGPVYLDLPADVLFAEVDEATVDWPQPWGPRDLSRPAMSQTDLGRLVDMLRASRRPVLLSGTGVFWSGAEKMLRELVEAAQIPFFTTPQGRGAIPEDHPLSFLSARSVAFREADLIVVLGTRLNYVIGHATPPRFNPGAKIVRIDIDPGEIAWAPREIDLGVVTDLGTALQQIVSAIADEPLKDLYASWRSRLGQRNDSKVAEQEAIISTDGVPVHPLRLCRELRDFMDRDAILCVDGQEILNYARQSIPTHMPGHRLNSGVFGTMGVGMPMGLGAKAACPDKQVIVLHGDGSFGMNAMEFDTAIRHGLPILVVISLNGGWTGDPNRERPGRDLGYTRYDLIAEALGGHGEYVERPEDIRPALERAMIAVRSGKAALVNVVTDWKARATTAEFTRYVT